jgi:hypothetical protein
MKLLSTLVLFRVLGTSASLDPVGLTYHLYENAALAGTPSASGITSSAQLSLAKKLQDACFLSGELVGTIEFPTMMTTSSDDNVRKDESVYAFDCRFSHTSTGWVWIDGHLVCQDGNPYQHRDEVDNPLPIQRSGKRRFPFRARITSNQTSCDNIASLQVSWTTNTTNDGTTLQLLKHRHPEGWADPFKLTPELSPPEQQREQLQRKLQQGWGPWLRINMLSIVKLPEGLLFTPRVCKLSTNECVLVVSPETPGVRVDLHAYDRSYVGYNLSLSTPNISMSVEYSVSGQHGETLQCLITILEDSPDDKDFVMDMEARYAWFRPGTISHETDDNGNMVIVFDTPGLGVTKLTTLSDRPPVEVVRASARNTPIQQATDSRRQLLSGEAKSTGGSSMLRVPLSGIKGARLGFVAGMKQPPTLDEMQATIKTNKAAEYKRIQAKFGPDKAPVAEAIQCAVMWTYIYCPVENGPLMPVSRSDGWSFTGNSGANTMDWTYVIFGKYSFLRLNLA